MTPSNIEPWMEAAAYKIGCDATVTEMHFMFKECAEIIAAHAPEQEWEAKEKALTSIIIEFLVADQTIRHADVGKADCKQCRVVYKARKLLNTPAAAVEDSSIKDARAAYYDDLAHGGAEHD